MSCIEESAEDTLKRMQNATRLASFDYRIYEELKEIKKELREKQALANLMEMLREEGDDEA